MLEKLPRAIGRALEGVGPGLEKSVFHSAEFAEAPAILRLTSDAFGDGSTIPARHTDDGEGTSPPLTWSGVPAGAAAVAILVEDPDAPTPVPLVHAIVLDLPGTDGGLPEGALDEDEDPDARPHTGKNSFFGQAWLPPDPPPAHGPHRYLFQVYALSRPLGLDGTPGRKAVIAAMRGRVIAKGSLIGIYERA